MKTKQEIKHALRTGKPVICYGPLMNGEFYVDDKEHLKVAYHGPPSEPAMSMHYSSAVIGHGSRKEIRGRVEA